MMLKEFSTEKDFNLLLKSNDLNLFLHINQRVIFFLKTILTKRLLV